ncbi:MAG TPA: hypothetical protein VK525_07030 [Candidatus Saccharimonadales bacterium]|nr:hypothetical protein [Candidatus Saccharimonadales bacterium]
MFETVIAGNPDTCRTEAEIADESRNRVAVVYEDSDGWHTQVLDDRVEQASSSFNALIENAKEVLSHYVNRRGDKVPTQLKTRGQLSLWLMEKDDGTVMGQKTNALPGN